MEFKVIDSETGEDITNKHFWIMRPNGDLHYLLLGNLMDDLHAVIVPVGQGVTNERKESPD